MKNIVSMSLRLLWLCKQVYLPIIFRIKYVHISNQEIFIMRQFE